MRIGHGFDVHAFGDGDHVTVGGVRIPHDRGLRAHSDGDVVLHALCDALLGAIAAGDIGTHFPDTDPQWRGADSRVLLDTVVGMVHDRGLEVANADLTVVAQAPRMQPYVETMNCRIAESLQVLIDNLRSLHDKITDGNFSAVRAFLDEARRARRDIQEISDRFRVSGDTKSDET